jgi:hypothetical protein
MKQSEDFMETVSSKDGTTIYSTCLPGEGSRFFGRRR